MRAAVQQGVGLMLVIAKQNNGFAQQGAGQGLACRDLMVPGGDISDIAEISAHVLTVVVGSNWAATMTSASHGWMYKRSTSALRRVNTARWLI